MLNNPTESAARRARKVIRDRGGNPAVLKEWLRELRFKLMDGHVPPRKNDGKNSFFEVTDFYEINGRKFLGVWQLDRECDGRPYSLDDFSLIDLGPITPPA